MRVYIHPYTVVILFALDRGHAAWVLPWQSHVAQHKTKSQAEWSEDHEMGCGAAALRYHQVDDDEDLEEEKGRRKVTPPAEILSRDFSSMLTLSFRGEGLKDGERSFLVVYTKASGENLWTELGKTEVCSLDTTWPVWGTIMELEFRVEVIRHMRCEAYKMASSDSLEDLWHHKFIGACEFTLTEAVTSRAKAGCWPR
eukprot:s978_g7.t1